MIDINTYHGIGNSVSYRAGLLAEVTKMLAEQERRDTSLCERLVLLAPEALREWLSEDSILSKLFLYGRCDTKIYFNGDYGFGDLIDVKAKMKALQKVWKDVVLIKFNEPESLRIEVCLSAVM